MKNRNFRRFFLAQFVSSLGDWIGVIAIAIFADKIGGATAVGTVLTARVLPGFIVGPLAGVIADRWDRKRTMVVADILISHWASFLSLKSRPISTIGSQTPNFTGEFWDVETCTGPDADNTQISSVPPEAAALIALMPGGSLQLPAYPPPPHCNPKGLTDLGRFLIRQMAKRGMVFDPDHMGARARDHECRENGGDDHVSAVHLSHLPPGRALTPATSSLRRRHPRHCSSLCMVMERASGTRCVKRS